MLLQSFSLYLLTIPLHDQQVFELDPSKYALQRFYQNFFILTVLMVSTHFLLQKFLQNNFQPVRCKCASVLSKLVHAPHFQRRRDFGNSIPLFSLHFFTNPPHCTRGSFILFAPLIDEFQYALLGPSLKCYKKMHIGISRYQKYPSPHADDPRRLYSL